MSERQYELAARIPEEREDERCPACGDGSLSRPRTVRITATHIQMVWRCNHCNGEVVTRDEHQSESCPTCGTEHALTSTQRAAALSVLEGTNGLFSREQPQDGT